ncbi:MAG: class I SAM-dependent methyltransferase [Acidobacteria bacterium]|nr:class I SAM-dependent methyltransferase [Acidobacteriota bacterium]
MNPLLKNILLTIPAVRRRRTERLRLESLLEETNATLADAIKQHRKELAGLSMEKGFRPGHFYSPYLDPEDPAVIQAMELEAQSSMTLDQLGIDEREVLGWFERIAEHYDAPRGKDQPFPKDSTAGRRYLYYANPAFPLADALALLAFMTTTRPRRYIEVGAGHSSCAALDINEQYLGGAAEMTFIDPHPETFHQLIADFPEDRQRIVSSPLQDVPIERFTALESGDILFIDSSHVAKTGSDVVDYMFRILPALRPGVFVHVHDIFYPFEYPRRWIVDQNRSWNEAYLLRAFLHANPRFRVLYLSDWIFKCRRDLFETRMPLCLLNAGASLWMRAV